MNRRCLGIAFFMILILVLYVLMFWFVLTSDAQAVPAEPELSKRTGWRVLWTGEVAVRFHEPGALCIEYAHPARKSYTKVSMEGNNSEFPLKGDPDDVEGITYWINKQHQRFRLCGGDWVSTIKKTFKENWPCGLVCSGNEANEKK